MTDAAMRLPFSDQDLAKIGYLITLWNQVELFLNLGIAVALQQETHVVSTILGEVTVNHRAKIFQQVAPTRLAGRPGMLALVEDCVALINDLAPYRNDIIHAKWAQGEIIKGWKKLSMDKEVNFNLIDQKIESIAVLGNMIAVVTWTLATDYFKSHGLKVEGPEPPWRDRFVSRIPLD